MQLTHRFTVPASRDEAWTAFANLERLAPCFPGATITSIDGADFTGTVKVKLGPIALVYTGSGTYVERDRDSARMVIEGRGRDKRGNGTATATVAATFVANGDQTDVEVLTDLSITGKPAQFGRGVISDVSDKLLDQFVTCVSGRFTEGLGEPEAERGAPADDRVELGAVPGDVEQPTDAQSGRGGSLGGVDAPPDVATAPGSVPRPAPVTAPPSHHDTPPDNQAQPDFNVVATLLPVMLKRYWSVLAGAGVAFFVIRKVIKGARR